MQQMLGTTLTTMAAWQATIGAPIEKLADQWPLLAVFCVALYLLFRAYQGLADRISDKLIEALNKNTAAFTEQAEASKRLVVVVEKFDRRLDTIEHRLDDLDPSRHHA